MRYEVLYISNEELYGIHDAKHQVAGTKNYEHGTIKKDKFVLLKSWETYEVYN